MGLPASSPTTTTSGSTSDSNLDSVEEEEEERKTREVEDALHHAFARKRGKPATVRSVSVVLRAGGLVGSVDMAWA